MTTSARRDLLALLMSSCVALGAAGPPVRPVPSWRLGPRAAVLAVLGAVVAVGMARKGLEARRAREVVERLRGDACTEADLLAAPKHGRAALVDLFRLLAEAPTPGLRAAAGRALAELWAADQLVAEEEKAVATRGYEVQWQGRRRYPRALAATIPLEVRFGLPFLSPAGGRTIRPDQLMWQYRVAGSRRASLEVPGEWSYGPVSVTVPIEPGDFPGNGPHRLVLEARVRTSGLTESWEHPLPKVPFAFEFDPLLRVDALYALPDEGRAAAMSRAVGLDATAAQEVRTIGSFLPLAGGFALGPPPSLVVREPLACDLAHRLWIELEGVEGRWLMRPLVVAADGLAIPSRFPLQPDSATPSLAVGGPGRHRARAVLEPDAELGWTRPEIRSVWPGGIVTDWVEVDVIRA